MNSLSPALRSGALLCLGAFLVALAACSRHASRPATSLSEQDKAVLATYEEIRAALVIDDLSTARRRALTLDKSLKPTPEAPSTPLEAAVQEISVAANLDKARTAFQTLSTDLIPLVDGTPGYYVMESPVPSGAEWVQTSPEVDNPYLGKPMRATGSVRK